jgi:uncharacterized membrane protein
MDEAPEQPPVEHQRAPREIWLAQVLIAVVLACVAGLWLKAQPSILHGFKVDCANGIWNGQQYSHLCYSDIVPLLGTEHLDGNRLPYLDGCPADETCDEYPVLSMYVMRLAAWISNGYAGFLFANALLLGIAASVTAVCLYLIAGGRRALWFALSPTLVIYGFMNWDLVAVAFAAAGMLAFFRRRDVSAGVLFGLGAAAKLFPALLVIPFAAERFRRREPDRGIHLAWAAAGTWVLLNLPFALFGWRGWTEFFRFNSNRAADFDSLWYIGCHLVGHDGCVPVNVVNVVAIVALVLGTGVLWAVRRLRQPDFPTWTVAFPAVVLFLLTNKVYSPQYGLWLLPLFALALPPLGRIRALWLFVAFEATDVAVFVTRFTWFHTLPPYEGGGAPFWAFEAAVLARAAVLVLCLAAWVTGHQQELRGPAMAEAPAVRSPDVSVGAPA